MHNEQMITVSERGTLKELVIDDNQELMKYLKKYQRDSNLQMLYSNILKLLEIIG
jgi:hypothetical protein